MWQILHTTFWKFSKHSNSRISLNWSIIDKVTTLSTTAYFFGALCTWVNSDDHVLSVGVAVVTARRWR